MINTVIVEDNLVIQEYLKDILLSDGDFHIVAMYRDAFDAEDFVIRGGVDLVLMDVQTLHNHSGLSIGERIRRYGGKTKVVAVTSLIDPDVIARAKKRSG